MTAFSFKQRFMLEGAMPERALLRLKRAGITLYDVQKPQKNRLVFSVAHKDGDKVWAIYPKSCYTEHGYNPYKITCLGEVGFGKTVKKLQKRAGLLVGALLFCGAYLYADGLVFGVRIVGATDYTREALIALRQNGVKPFSKYPQGQEDLICADLLACDGVEFCSVKKVGLWAEVEIRKGNFTKTQMLTGDMRSTRTGKVISLHALSGTPLKSVGDTVREGESLVGAWFLRVNGEGDEVKTPTEVIARATIECTYQVTLDASDEESAWAMAYLGANLTGEETLTQKSIEKNGELFAVSITYTALQQWNL
ncbi:MAG: sporulation protein YqfD [Clostridia bacterium]|nr:sporulation protein YqfD [Clostridia bacterium]